MAFCRECGAEINPQAVICPKCGCATGYKVAKEVSSDNYGGIVTLLLFLFLAPFGAHRFYNGKMVSGAFMLLLSILTFVGFFVIGFLMGASGSSFALEDNHQTDLFLSTMPVGIMVAMILMLFAIMIWWIVDFILIVSGNFRDKYNNKIKL